MAELVTDIKEKGILVPLISCPDGTIVCGHNRHHAALTAGLERVPVQRILSPLTDDLEREIMKSENDRRRGGNEGRGIPYREGAENDWTAGAVRGVEKEWTEGREAKSLGGEVNGDG